MVYRYALIVAASVFLVAGCVEDPPAPPPAKVVSLSYARDHGCVIVDAGAKVRCWGGNNNGDVPIGSEAPSSETVAVPLLSDAVQIGGYCSVVADGGVRCWGPNNAGQLGNGTVGAAVGVPVDVAGIDDAVQVDSEGNIACAVVADGGVRCWGDNQAGGVGDGTHGPTTYTDIRSTPVPVVGLDDATQVSVGAMHACAVREGGEVACWGYQWEGSLGNGLDAVHFQHDPPPPAVDHPVAVSGIDDAVELSTNGRFTTCALHETGKVSCWGENSWGVTGVGYAPGAPDVVGLETVPTPAEVAGVDGASDVAVGTWQACAVVGGGAVKCWGDNYWGEAGQIGWPQNDPVLTPSTVDGLSGVTAIDAGEERTCALLSDGTVRCWGYGWNNALGNPDAGGPIPHPVLGLG